jgi:hypothetical protein
MTEWSFISFSFSQEYRAGTDHSGGGVGWLVNFFISSIGIISYFCRFLPINCNHGRALSISGMHALSIWRGRENNFSNFQQLLNRKTFNWLRPKVELQESKVWPVDPKDRPKMWVHLVPLDAGLKEIVLHIKPRSDPADSQTPFLYLPETATQADRGGAFIKRSLASILSRCLTG